MTLKKNTKKPSESLLQNLCSRVTTTTKNILPKSDQRLSRDQLVYQGNHNGRSISQLGNRSSSELNKLHASILRKASLDNPDSRQSFDSGLNTDPSRNNRSSPEDELRNNSLSKVVPSMSNMSKARIMQILQNRANSISQEKFRKNSLDKIKKPKTNSEYRDKACHLNPEEYYEAKLKNLEDRIRKHNSNVKSFNCGADKVGSDAFKKKPNISDGTRTIKPFIARTKSESTNMSASNVKIPVKIILSGYTPSDEGYCGRFNKDTNNYGVIRATDLYKMKSSELL